MSEASVLVGAGCWVLGLLVVWERQFTSLDLMTLASQDWKLQAKISVGPLPASHLKLPLASTLTVYIHG